MDTPRRKTRRTANACIPCRQSKIKCTGDEPCANCKRRLVKCRFSDAGVIFACSERGNHEPQRCPSDVYSTGSKRSSDAAFGSDNEYDDITISSRPRELRFNHARDESRCAYTSPFTLPSTTIKNTHRNKRYWIWLAPSSTWSFTARLTLMMAEKLQLETPFSAPSFLNDEIYSLRWTAAPVDDPPDVTGLPPIEHALYLYSTVKFHLGQNYQFLDETTFVQNVEDFYHGNPVQKAAESRLWFVHFLLILAFGQAFLSRPKNPKEPRGAKFFVRAMALLPDPTSLWRDSLLAIEVLALVGLYLYSIYQRESAQLYVAQAIRIAQLEGLHTQLPEDVLGSETVVRCRNLWWTLYIMDRHFSCSLGVPINTQDTDITTLFDPPSTSSQRDGTLALRVKLSHLLSSIINTVYKSERAPLGEFLEETRKILQTLAGHAQEIERITRIKLQTSVDTMSRGTRDVTLLYHQCVIMATRPLLLSALKQKLDSFGEDARNLESLLAPLTPLMSTGIKSAVKTLQILSVEECLTDVFLPFDLEYAYGAAIHLTIASALFPSTTALDAPAHSLEARAILDDMVRKGNAVAEVRRAELLHLEFLFGEFSTRSKHQGFLVHPDSSAIEVEDLAAVINEPELVSLTTLDESQSLLSASETPNNVEFLDSVGISSDDFLSIVEEMGSHDDLPFTVLDLEQFWK